MYNLYQMLPSFNEFRGAIDRERNGSTGKEMARPGKKWLLPTPLASYRLGKKRSAKNNNFCRFCRLCSGIHTKVTNYGKVFAELHVVWQDFGVPGPNFVEPLPVHSGRYPGIRRSSNFVLLLLFSYCLLFFICLLSYMSYTKCLFVINIIVTSQIFLKQSTLILNQTSPNFQQNTETTVKKVSL